MMLIMLFLCDPTNLSVFFLAVITGCVAIKISAKTSGPMNVEDFTGKVLIHVTDYRFR
jgi:hypothetical protein